MRVTNAVLCLGLAGVALSQDAQPREGWIPAAEAPRARVRADLHARLLALKNRVASRIGPLRGLAVPTKGDLRLAVVLIDFPDHARPEKFAAPANWEQAMFSRGTWARTPSGDVAFGSVADWYGENSGGALSLGGKVFDWVTVKTPRAALAGLPAPVAQGQVFGAAIDAVLARDGARALDGFHALAFVTAGVRDQLARGAVLWPHASVMFHGGRAYSYYTMNSGDERFEPIGVHCHELGHVLGILDKYGVGPHTGLGQWCAMALGAHGANGGGIALDAPVRSPEATVRGLLDQQLEQGREWLRELFGGRRRAPPIGAAPPRPGEAKPLHLCAVCKVRLGWIEPITVDATRPLRVFLTAVEREPGQVLRIPLDRWGREALLLEFRRKIGFDAELPREGLLVWRTGSPLAIARTFVPFEQVELIAAHGIASTDSALRDPQAVPFPARDKREVVVGGEWPGARRVKLSAIAQEGERLYLEIGPR